MFRVDCPAADFLSACPVTFPCFPHRYQYEQTRTTVLSVMDPLMQRYNELLMLSRTSPTAPVLANIKIVECELVPRCSVIAVCALNGQQWS